MDTVIDAVASICQEANYEMRPDMERALRGAHASETAPLGRHVLLQLIDNAEIARTGRVPYCQDTGVVVICASVGQELLVVGGDLTEALNAGVRKGYVEGYLRASIVRSPFDRKNTGDNTPAVIHYDIVPGDTLTISLTAKGAGSENMSRAVMLNPSDGVEGFKDFVVDTVSRAGENACPPLLVGVGAGGSFDYSAYLAKKSLFREVGSPNPDRDLEALEDEIHERCNKLGIGPQGMGGINTVLDVFINVYPCHIASLPVAVNIQCPAQRHRTVVL